MAVSVTVGLGRIGAVVTAWILAVVVILPAAAQTVTPDSSSSISISSSAGTTTGSTNLRLSIGTDTNVMGFKFDIQFPRDTFSFDSTAYTAGDLLTTNATGSETYVFVIDQDSANLRPTATVTVIGVRMQSSTANKGLNNATFTLLSALRFIKLNTDTTFLNQRDTIMVTNFVFRDRANNTVTSSKVSLPLYLYLQLLARGGNFDGSGDGIGDVNDVNLILRIIAGAEASAGRNDYGRSGDAVKPYDQRTSDGVFDVEDLNILIRYIAGVGE